MSHAHSLRPLSRNKASATPLAASHVQRGPPPRSGAGTTRFFQHPMRVHERRCPWTAHHTYGLVATIAAVPDLIVGDTVVRVDNADERSW